MEPSPILVIESNPVVERQLTDILSTSGYTLYGLDSPESLIKILSRRPFPLVLIDAVRPGMDGPGVIRALKARFPDTAFIATGSGLSVDKVLHLLRAGAVDYLAKPFDPAELTHCVDVALQVRAEDTGSLGMMAELPSFGDPNEESSFPAMAPPPEAEEVSLSPTSKARLTEFLDATLATFLALEKENHSLTVQVQELENPEQAARRHRKLDVWVAHPDEAFCTGMLSLAARLRLDIRPPLATGGGVLDRLSTAQPDILVLADMLADIPGMIVLETVSAEYRNVACVMVSNWGTPSMEGELVGPDGSERISRHLSTVEDLVALIEDAKLRCFDADLGREFAKKFKDRHSQFLTDFSELKQALLEEE